MSVADLDAYKTKIMPRRVINGISQDYKTSTTGANAAKFRSTWIWTGGDTTASAPTTAAALTNSTTGALRGSPTADSYLLGMDVSTNFNGGTAILIDRLSHQGGLAAGAATNGNTQTTNLDTAALTRYTDGIGVYGGLEVYSTIGTTAATFTVNYTNTADAAKTTHAMDIGATGNREVGWLMPFSLAEGDVGIKSVQSVVIATTGTAGNVGVTLFKPLAYFPIEVLRQRQTIDLLRHGGVMPLIKANACLSWLLVSGTANTNSPFFHASLYMDPA